MLVPCWYKNYELPFIPVLSHDLPPGKECRGRQKIFLSSISTLFQFFVFPEIKPCKSCVNCPSVLRKAFIYVASEALTIYCPSRRTVFLPCLNTPVFLGFRSYTCSFFRLFTAYFGVLFSSNCVKICVKTPPEKPFYTLTLFSDIWMA